MGRIIGFSIKCFFSHIMNLLKTNHEKILVLSVSGTPVGSVLSFSTNFRNNKADNERWLLQ